MALDTDSGTLLAAVTLTGGTITSSFNADNMRCFAVQSVVSNGLFTTGTYAWLEGSLDGTNYAAIPDSTTTVSGTGTTYLWNYDAPAFNYVRCGFTVPSGNIVAAVTFRTVGDR